MELSNQLPGSHPLTAPVHPSERVTGPPELHHSEGRYPQLHKDAHRYRGSGAGVMATLRTAALNLLLLAGFPSIRNDSRRTLRRLPHLVPIGLQRLPNRSQINLLAVSEFGRRLRENGSRGTDHGSVSIALLLGDQVPHPLIGAYPSPSKFDHRDDLVAFLPPPELYRKVLTSALG
jgi:hypothetical protein